MANNDRLYSKETVPEQAEKEYPDTDPSELSPELLDRIKHPARIDDAMRELSPDELRGNNALVPEMLDEPSDEMIGFTRD